MNEKVYAVAKRFLRAFVAGAAGTMLPMLVFSGEDWGDLQIWFIRLSIAGIAGGVAGVIMAADKWYRWQD